MLLSTKHPSTIISPASKLLKNPKAHQNFITDLIYFFSSIRFISDDSLLFFFLHILSIGSRSGSKVNKNDDMAYYAKKLVTCFTKMSNKKRNSMEE